MSLSRTRHHKICYPSLIARRTPHTRDSGLRQPSEAGYSLVALLALMTVMALLAAAAAPSIRQQSQREREKEAIFRGEQVAAAIRSYYVSRLTIAGVPGDQSLPTTIDQLLEGVPVRGGSKKRQILRPSAAKDPLSSSGEWRLVSPRSQPLLEFQRSVILYAGNFLPPSRDQQLVQLQQFAVPQMTNVLGSGSTRPEPSSSEAGEDFSGPFVGVASRSTNHAVLYYYGIDRHDQWIFTPLFR